MFFQSSTYFTEGVLLVSITLVIFQRGGGGGGGVGSLANFMERVQLLVEGVVSSIPKDYDF